MNRINAFVYAKDENEALGKGKEVFNKLMEKKMYDWFATYDEINPGRPVKPDADLIAEHAADSVNVQSARDVLKQPLPFAIKVNSPFGKQMMEGINNNFTRQEYLSGLTDKEIDEIVHSLPEPTTPEERYTHFSMLMELNSAKAKVHHSAFLFDMDATPIENKKDLKKVLDRVLELWIIPAQVHL